MNGFRPDRRNVVVTGIGLISPLGTTTGQFWEKCMDNQSCAKPIPDQWFDYAQFSSRLYTPLPEIDFSQFCLSRIERIQFDPCQQLAIAATIQALKGAGLELRLEKERKNTYSIESLNPYRTGVFIGTGSGGISSLISAQMFHTTSPLRQILTDMNHAKITEEIRSSLQKVENSLRIPARFNPFTVPMMMPNGSASCIGIKFSFCGPNQTFCSACASGTVALGHAFKSIVHGEIDCAVCGGVEYLRDEYGGIFRSFDIAGTLGKGDKKECFCPFDKKRSGFLFSEGGAGILILEEENHARKRNAPILARISGYAESFDPYGIMSMEPNGIMIEEMLRELLDNLRIKPQDIDYINAHGTGTVSNDSIECSVIERIFGKETAVNSTKSLIGHTIGACGAIETAVCVLSIIKQETHGCLNLNEPQLPLNFIKVPGKLKIKRALKQSFAFGGHNAAIILEKYP
jgi:3-oxoacyl-[acyl-carrier-protein] synthase II